MSKRAIRDRLPTPVIFLVTLVTLAGATFAVTEAGARFRVVDPALLENADFAEGGRYWSGGPAGVRLGRGSPRELILTARGKTRPAVVSRLLPPRGQYDHVRVSVDLRTVGVAGISAPWQGAQVLLTSFDERNRRLRHWPREIARVAGSTDWTRYRGTIPLSEEMRRMWLTIYVAAESGQLMLRDLRVDGVVEARSFTSLRFGVKAAWAVVWIWVAFILTSRRHRTTGRLGTLLLGTLLLAGGLMPAPELGRSVDLLQRWAGAFVLAGARIVMPPPADPLARPAPSETARDSDLRPSPPEAPGQAGAGRPAPRGESPSAPAGRAETDRLAPAVPGSVLPAWARRNANTHLIAFALLALVAVWSYRSYPLVQVLGALVLLAIVIEVLQALSVTREPQLSDLLDDLAGIAAGSAAARVAWRAFAFRRQRRPSPPPEPLP